MNYFALFAKGFNFKNSADEKTTRYGSLFDSEITIRLWLF